jgi:hypothetical protein
MGEAIVRELAWAELKIVPSLIISVKEFFERYPEGLILSKETGLEKAMGRQLMIEPHSNHFAFAWLAFYPDTIIYGENELE